MKDDDFRRAEGQILDDPAFDPDPFDLYALVPWALAFALVVIVALMIAAAASSGMPV